MRKKNVVKVVYKLLVRTVSIVSLSLSLSLSLYTVAITVILFSK